MKSGGLQTLPFLELSKRKCMIVSKERVKFNCFLYLFFPTLVLPPCAPCVSLASPSGNGRASKNHPFSFSEFCKFHSIFG